MKAHMSFFHNREDVRQISYTLLCNAITEILDTVELIYLFFEIGTSPSVVDATRDAFMAFLDRNVHTQRHQDRDGTHDIPRVGFQAEKV